MTGKCPVHHIVSVISLVLACILNQSQQHKFEFVEAIFKSTLWTLILKIACKLYKQLLILSSFCIPLSLYAFFCLFLLLFLFYFFGEHFAKHLHWKKKSCRFGTTWGWVNDDKVFILVNYLFKGQKVTCFVVNYMDFITSHGLNSL